MAAQCACHHPVEAVAPHFADEAAPSAQQCDGAGENARRAAGRFYNRIHVLDEHSLTPGYKIHKQLPQSQDRLARSYISAVSALFHSYCTAFFCLCKILVIIFQYK